MHREQAVIARNPARFKVLAAGRRWGKTRLGTVLCIARALEGRRAWWVAPSFPIAEIGWRLIRHLAKQMPGTEIHLGDRRAQFPTGGWVQVKSADNPDSLRGEGLDLVVLDECAFMAEEAWQEALRPALSDRCGGALFISTPKGRNWFWRLYQGVDGEDWARWHFPTSANPFIPAGEIEAAKANLPERVYLQEFQAEFIDDAGGVFRRVIEAATAKTLDHGEPGGEYVIGVDWGKYEDFTVFAVIDQATASCVYLDRFNRIDYMMQEERLVALVQRFKPQLIVAERNAMGEPIIERLQAQNLPVQPFLTTVASKGELVDALALAFEKSELKIPADPILISELQAYQAERLPSGMLRYGAPGGMHDDCVMALGMAWMGARPGRAIDLFVPGAGTTFDHPLKGQEVEPDKLNRERMEANDSCWT